MTWKPKKGKFEYNLATVLRIRNIMEKREQRIYQEKVKVFEEEKTKETEIKIFKIIKSMIWQTGCPVKSKTFSTVMRRHSYLGKVKDDVLQQEQKTVEAEQLKEEQREKLVRAVQDRKIIEKDKEHKKDKWKKFMGKEELKFIDDISTSRFFRRD